jgi:hypothetical protein
MAIYDTISAAIDDSNLNPPGPNPAIKARVTGEAGDRIMLPYVLGTSDTKQMVLCYQYDGYVYPPHPLKTPHFSPKNWRCFDLAKFSAVTQVSFSPANAFTPHKMTGKERQRQNCVQIPDNFRKN